MRARVQGHIPRRPRARARCGAPTGRASPAPCRWRASMSRATPRGCCCGRARATRVRPLACSVHNKGQEILLLEIRTAWEPPSARWAGLCVYSWAVLCVCVCAAPSAGGRAAAGWLGRGCLNVLPPLREGPAGQEQQRAPAPTALCPPRLTRTLHPAPQPGRQGQVDPGPAGRGGRRGAPRGAARATTRKRHPARPARRRGGGQRAAERCGVTGCVHRLCSLW